MKTIKKIGYGLLSLVTLLFYTVTTGFPRSRIFSSIKEKVLKIQKNSSNAPETLILAQSDTSHGDEYASHTSHRSHSSHRSHASHRSGTSGGVVSKPATQKTKATTGLPAALANTYAAFLPASDVEAITGLVGIQQTLDQATVHYLLIDGKEILQVKFLNKNYFIKSKNDGRYSPITGIQDDALLGTPQLPVQLLVLRGKYCIEITTFPKEGLELFLSVDQLKTIARYITTRFSGY